jgi:hypothetical protein
MWPLSLSAIYLKQLFSMLLYMPSVGRLAPADAPERNGVASTLIPLC